MTGVEGAAKFGFSESDLLSSTTGLIQRDVKIFRVGTFTDSLGRTRTYTAEDLDVAVQNFQLLRELNIIPNVPVREDHTISIKDVVGYFLSVRREGNLLLGDFEWSSQAAKEKWDAKKYRNRSLEIGAYVTNDGTKYDPVVLGLAFVDFPAVEGLYRIADHTGEETMTKKTPEEIAAEEAAAAQAAADQAAADAVAQAAAEEAAAAQAAADAAAQAAADQAAADQAAAAAAAAQEPVGAHRANVQPQAFRLNGDEVSDYARVQAHIVELETFRTETIKFGRDSFVSGLATNRIITGPQAEKFGKLVHTMSEDQFEAFKEGFEGAAPANLFGRHDLGDTGAALDADAARADRISVLQGIVASHRARGASTDDISKMSSFQELQTLTATA